jgi:hypothetical protein
MVSIFFSEVGEYWNENNVSLLAQRKRCIFSLQSSGSFGMCAACSPVTIGDGQAEKGKRARSQRSRESEGATLSKRTRKKHGIQTLNGNSAGLID